MCLLAPPTQPNQTGFVQVSRHCRGQLSRTDSIRRTTPSWALRKTQEVIWLFPVVLGLEVFVAIAACRDSDPNAFACNAHEETPRSVFNTGNGFSLIHFPAGAVLIGTSNMGDSLVRIVTIRFIDAGNLDCLSHFGFFFRMKVNEQTRNRGCPKRA